MTGSERFFEPGAKGKVLTLEARQPAAAKAKPKAVDPAIVYFPDGLKRHYMDVLLRYKNELSKAGGKPVGWQSIRDQMMAREDDLEAERQGWNKRQKKVDRPRSGLVGIEDFKGWYNPKNCHLPTDPKFQFIDRFIRGLRVEGKLDAIELAATVAQREYFRESLTQFYRPDRAFSPEFVMADRPPLSESVPAILDKAVFVGCCVFDPEGESVLFVREGYRRFAIVVLCGEYRQCMVAVDVVACFLPDRVWQREATQKGPVKSRAWDVLSGLAIADMRVMHLFSGFLVPEFCRARGIFNSRTVIANFVMRKVQEAGFWHEGMARSSGRYYVPRVLLGIDDVAVLVWPDSGSDTLVRLGLQPIIEQESLGGGKVQRAGFVKVEDNDVLAALRAQFEIGYRPC